MSLKKIKFGNKEVNKKEFYSSQLLGFYRKKYLFCV